VSIEYCQDLNYNKGATPKDVAQCGGVIVVHRQPGGSGGGAGRGAKQADPGPGRRAECSTLWEARFLL
jgi:hypothetical protein